MKKNSSALCGYGYSLLLSKVAQNDKHFNCIVTTQNFFRFCFPRILNWSILVNIKPKKISYITTKYCLKIWHKAGLAIIAAVKDIHILKYIYSCLFSELWSNNQYTPNSQILLRYQDIRQTETIANFRTAMSMQQYIFHTSIKQKFCLGVQVEYIFKLAFQY